METVPLPKTAKPTKKSTSVSSKNLASGKPKVTKNTAEAKECKKLKTELEAAQNTILVLEKQLNDEISKRAELEQLLEEANKKIDSDVKQEVQVEFYDENDLANKFLRVYIHKFINALEPFSSTPYKFINLNICFRLLANYTSQFEKFKKDKKIYEDDCENNPIFKNEDRDKLYEKFVYSLKDKDVSDHIVKGGYPKFISDNVRDNYYVNQDDRDRSYFYWSDKNFLFLK